MASLCADLRAEYSELADLVSGFDPQDWQLSTGFFQWTPWDEISHLLYFDQQALTALGNADVFARDATALMKRTVEQGEAISDICHACYGHLSGAELVAVWRPCFNELVDRLSCLDAKARLPWYGPTMSARSFATARLMECWAHGQDIWDAVRRRRPGHARLRHIAHLGVSTFNWSFAVRGQQPPGPAPCVDLQGPGGERWTWGDPASSEQVQGAALDFCLVVTQRRHVQDTGLRVAGPVAQAWMSVAQCFAGGAAIGPAPGARRIHYPDD